MKYKKSKSKKYKILFKNILVDSFVDSCIYFSSPNHNYSLKNYDILIPYFILSLQ